MNQKRNRLGCLFLFFCKNSLWARCAFWDDSRRTRGDRRRSLRQAKHSAACASPVFDAGCSFGAPRAPTKVQDARFWVDSRRMRGDRRRSLRQVKHSAACASPIFDAGCSFGAPKAYEGTSSADKSARCTKIICSRRRRAWFRYTSSRTPPQ